MRLRISCVKETEWKGSQTERHLKMNSFAEGKCLEIRTALGYFVFHQLYVL